MGRGCKWDKKRWLDNGFHGRPKRRKRLAPGFVVRDCKINPKRVFLRRLEREGTVSLFASRYSHFLICEWNRAMCLAISVLRPASNDMSVLRRSVVSTHVTIQLSGPCHACEKCHKGQGADTVGQFHPLQRPPPLRSPVSKTHLR